MLHPDHTLLSLHSTQFPRPPPPTARSTQPPFLPHQEKAGLSGK